MNKLFLIGNGFDLAHGLKTKYSDFILWYLNECFKAFNSLDQFQDELIKIDSPAKIPIFSDLGEFQNYRGPNCISVQSSISNSIAYDFINILINTNLNANWVDIESEYYKFLLKILSGYWGPDKRLDREGRIINKIFDKNNQLKLLNEAFEYIKNKFINYLNTIKTIKCPDNEILMYLNNEINNDFNIDENNEILFLCFNYTSNINTYLNSINTASNLSLIKIHGCLKEKNNPIIFGYGDEKDENYAKLKSENNNEYLRNIKSYSYFKTLNYWKLLKYIDSQEYDVVIMGHSCGTSDGTLLNTIFENKNCRRIKVYYYEKDISTNDYIDKTMEISRHFKSDADMRRKIFPFPKCLPLKKYVPEFSKN